MASSSTIHPDPFLPAEGVGDDEVDFPSHVRTYNRFVHTLGWFAFHVLIILAALYFFAIANNPALGITLIVVALAVLGIGLSRRSPIQRDLAAGLRSGPGAKDPPIDPNA